jgi:hypothetical protein
MVNNKTPNGLFETTNLTLAAFLYAKEVEFNGLRWTNPNQAVFLFEQPPDEILASWLKDDGKFIKKYEEARIFLRDKVDGKR